MSRRIARVGIGFALGGFVTGGIGLDARAAVLPFAVELRFQTGATAPFGFDTAGFATVNGSSGGLHVTSFSLAAGAIAHGPDVMPYTDPGVAPISAVIFQLANEAGSVVETTGGILRGAIGLSGFVRYCLFGSSHACTDPIANLSVPLDPIGVGGAAYVGGVSPLTVIGAPWTTGTAAVGTITAMGARSGPASVTSTTAQPGGSIQLVTPVFVFQGFEAIPTFVSLTIRFVPEPATLALLAAGIAGLAAAGSRTRRR